LMMAPAITERAALPVQITRSEGTSV